MAQDKKGINSKSALERAKRSQVHIDRMRAILNTDESDDDIPTG